MVFPRDPTTHPKYYSPYYGDPQNGSLYFWKPQIYIHQIVESAAGCCGMLAVFFEENAWVLV